MSNIDKTVIDFGKHEGCYVQFEDVSASGCTNPLFTVKYESTMSAEEWADVTRSG